MMRFSFWYGGCQEEDLDWLQEAVQLLKTNQWKAGTPLYFDGCGWDGQKVRQDAAMDLLEALKDNTSARSMFLRNASLDFKAQQALSEVFEQNRHLDTIAIKNVRSGNEAMTVPASLFQSTSVKSLSLQKVRIGASGCVQLTTMLRTSQTLTSLSLEQVELKGSLKSISEAIANSQSLKKLTLKGNRFSQDEIEELLQAIGCNRSLKRVDLEALDLSGKHANALADMMARNQHLQQLSLRKNDLDGSATNVFMREGLCRNTSLRDLFLTFNPIGDDGAQAIVTAMQQNTSLKHLCLVNCDIWTEGCQTIAKGLAKMRGLSVLDMDCNEMENCPLEILQSLKEENCVLTKFSERLPMLIKNADGAYDDETVALWKEIEVYLRWNKAGRRVFSQTRADCLLATLMSKSSNQQDVLFRFLQNTSL